MLEYSQAGGAVCEGKAWQELGLTGGQGYRSNEQEGWWQGVGEKCLLGHGDPWKQAQMLLSVVGESPECDEMSSQ